ncbi:MAG: fructose-1,6-bisphosphate aldolase, class II, fructose-bisphosphate aldolase, class II [Candidatus Moranbacteria bacterium GW2011_GWC1_45_18]|nr:MAG: Fructose/tagatose bisphosphate aldolase [Candidatus Moranbacteria bacterium GW2011_GWC2_40_12]KKT33894.1 MAG: Fructose/tagatose bisphosphate aldolase [Candidatus Moranbacteria bacterium GW2011_GWF2_44_10]KKT71885.1 MAG: Fructose/tagatose bisphosphate aldolase [Candidatus Moranbacteria bacterium GW2011_GWF1_44_4]KKT99794.1 MAG: fructose-1,6-bisphosphate aldolase, class II, fructose-bisphosphate aldolase, class II [Candidatus Moranbacteria bacterium GW2011_GWC1_45_18]OGI23406.1 MAG: hypot
MLASVKNILSEAKNKGYAVGAFNAFNMEEAQAIVRAAVKKHTPVIIQITEKTMNYAGDGVIYDVVKTVIEKESASIPIGFHLDHGHSFDVVMRAINAGMSSVMIDASEFSLRENMAITKRVVDYAHAKNVAVQAELGNVPYLGGMDQNPDWDKIMTNPPDAKWLVEETGIDALAVAIGNAHDFFRERPEPDWSRLEEINRLLPNTPLILHGASDWVNHKVTEAVKRGVVCFNVDTDLRVAFNTVLCQFTHDKCTIIDPRTVMAEAREAVQRVVEKKIELFRETSKK